MIDLNRINGGLKLLKYIMKTEIKDKPWSKEALVKKLEKHPNPYIKNTNTK
jgi:hypothetical protein